MKAAVSQRQCDSSTPRRHETEAPAAISVVAVERPEPPRRRGHDREDDEVDDDEREVTGASRRRRNQFMGPSGPGIFHRPRLVIQVVAPSQ